LVKLFFNSSKLSGTSKETTNNVAAKAKTASLMASSLFLDYFDFMLAKI